MHPIESEHHLTFGPFRLDTMRGRLWRGAQLTTLQARSLAMLRYLAEHPGRLVTKAELRQHVWAGTHVTDTVLRVCVHEIRGALGDVAAAPRYLETVERQGYRWLAEGDLEVPSRLKAGPLVARQGEVVSLGRWLQRAAQGAHQLVFVSGEAGVGKTPVVDLRLARLGAGSAVPLARGQQAKSLELRAALSLSWLWQQQGKSQDVYNLLATIYDWFTEGLDTADLQEAHALLEELS
jgi:DNA-binding winged helix-turn-helix (wHTH) protein